MGRLSRVMIISINCDPLHTLVMKTEHCSEAVQKLQYESSEQNIEHFRKTHMPRTTL
jgi:hypothetical protein